MLSKELLERSWMLPVTDFSEIAVKRKNKKQSEVNHTRNDTTHALIVSV